MNGFTMNNREKVITIDFLFCLPIGKKIHNDTR